jgi:hypothetical protein
VTVFPKFAFSGNLGDGAIILCPDCEGKCEEYEYGLPKDTIGTTAEILVLLLTGWAWFGHERNLALLQWRIEKGIRLS